MAPTLLFITGVLAGLIAGFILSRVFGRSRSGDGSGEARLLEERLLKADQGLEQFDGFVTTRLGHDVSLADARVALAVGRPDTGANRSWLPQVVC
mgnify:CR=1 FL=1